MKYQSIIILFALFLTTQIFAQNKDFQIQKTDVNYDASLDQYVFEITVGGKAGATTPTPKGQLNGAPVMAYVFPTDLAPESVGFGDVEGILALALTSHPDFDDTPLWDENKDRKYDNDGIVWHPHWVVLSEDKRVKGGLSVKQFKKGDESVILPPTNPGMPMYMDSPGYPVVTSGNSIKVIVPGYRVDADQVFHFDAVTAYLQVNTSDTGKPMLGVYEVYSVASGDLSLPYLVNR